MMLTYPIKRHHSPAVNDSLLEDLALHQLLFEHFDDPNSYLSCDVNAIGERNRALQWMLLHPTALSFMKAFRDALYELKETARSLDSDAILVLANLGIIAKVHAAARDLYEELSSINTSNVSEIRALHQGLAQVIDLVFPDNFYEAWDQFAQGLDHIGSLVYKIRINRKVQIESIAIQGVYKHKTLKTNAPGLKSLLLGKGKTFSLKTDTRSTPGYSYDPSRSLSMLERLKYVLNHLLIKQTSSVRTGIRTAILRVYQNFAALYEEMDFITRAADFLHAIECEDMAFTFATINSSMEDPITIQGMYHPTLLAQAKTITRNNLRAVNGRHVVLLGGYNCDGKTTFLRTVGAVQVFFQMGLPCPVQNACLYPASSLVSVFAGEEDTGLLHGKLGQELKKLHAALKLLSEDGCFFFNEPITSTSATENYHISKEILCILLAKGHRGVWVTHLYRLFGDVEDIHQLHLCSDLVCMRTRQGNLDDPPFSVMEGVPLQDSGARLIH